MRQAHVFISGFVQAIGFRAFIKQHAEELNITGWVRNLPAGPLRREASKAGLRDGRVEAIFQGDENHIKEMIEHCHDGPFLAEVKEVVVKWEETEEMLDKFDIIL